MPPPPSSRATAGVLVPIRAATSACVRPALRRAFSNSSSKANSSARATYSALTAGSFSIFLMSCLCVIIGYYLFHPLASDLQLLGRRSGRLLHEGMEHHDSPTGPRAEEDSANAFLGLHP